MTHEQSAPKNKKNATKDTKVVEEAAAVVKAKAAEFESATFEDFNHVDSKGNPTDMLGFPWSKTTAKDDP